MHLWECNWYIVGCLSHVSHGLNDCGVNCVKAETIMVQNAVMGFNNGVTYKQFIVGVRFQLSVRGQIVGCTLSLE